MTSPTTKKAIPGRRFGSAYDLNRRRNDQPRMSALALLLTLILFAPAAIAQHSTTTHANGDFAALGFVSQNEATTVIVSRTSQAQGSTTTFLFYEHAVFDLNQGTVTSRVGSGFISDSAFQKQGQTASLNVDTSQVTGFDNQLCISTADTTTCTPTTGTAVNAQWTEVPFIGSKSSGMSTNTFGRDIKFIFTGTQELNGALANVNLLGTVSTGVDGVLGTNHNATIIVQHP